MSGMPQRMISRSRSSDGGSAGGSPLSRSRASTAKASSRPSATASGDGGGAGWNIEPLGRSSARRIEVSPVR